MISSDALLLVLILALFWILLQRTKRLEGRLDGLSELVGPAPERAPQVEPSSHVRELALGGERAAAIDLLCAEAKIDVERATEIVDGLSASPE